MKNLIREKLLPAVKGGGFFRDDLMIWCGSVIKGEDGLLLGAETGLWSQLALSQPGGAGGQRYPGGAFPSGRNRPSPPGSGIF